MQKQIKTEIEIENDYKDFEKQSQQNFYSVFGQVAENTDKRWLNMLYMAQESNNAKHRWRFI